MLSQKLIQSLCSSLGSPICTTPFISFPVLQCIPPTLAIQLSWTLNVKTEEMQASTVHFLLLIRNMNEKASFCALYF